jgi:hypothetical protein
MPLLADHEIKKDLAGSRNQGSPHDKHCNSSLVCFRPAFSYLGSTTPQPAGSAVQVGIYNAEYAIVAGSIFLDFKPATFYSLRQLSVTLRPSLKLPLASIRPSCSDPIISLTAKRDPSARLLCMWMATSPDPEILPDR